MQQSSREIHQKNDYTSAMLEPISQQGTDIYIDCHMHKKLRHTKTLTNNISRNSKIQNAIDTALPKRAQWHCPAMQNPLSKDQ